MKMKRKIYWNICILALVSMVLGTLITVALLCSDLQRQMRRTVRTQARYLGAAMNTSGEDFLKRLESRGDGESESRITWIAADGTVLYDSYADDEELENHLDRPEVAQALAEGSGQSTRLSGTLAKRTYYYAERLDDGTVIRAASTAKSGYAAVANTLPWMVLMALAIFCLTLWIAHLQTLSIVRPINELELDDPDPEKVYDELSPLIRKLENQNKTIGDQMRLLWEKQEEFTAITENMSEGFIVVDRHADVISFNSSAVRILGVNMIRPNGQPVNVLDLNRSSAFRQVMDSALHGEHAEQPLELRGRCYQLIANPVTMRTVPGDKAQGAVAVILDVTEKEQREELRREFTANVSHELKTPLTSISGYAEIMKNGMVQPGDMQRFAGKIYDEAQRLITLVRDIIRLSRLDEGSVSLEKTTVDLHMIAAGVLSHLKETARKAKVSLVLKGESVTVQGTDVILDEMIFNLCENAVKYNRPDGYVIVTVGKEKGRAFVEVEDNGIGIPLEDQPRVFERFYRVDKSHSRQVGGTGLGLSIVKHGVLYHRADISLKSEPGKGTTVRITFQPAVRTDQESVC